MIKFRGRLVIMSVTFLLGVAAAWGLLLGDDDTARRADAPVAAQNAQSVRVQVPAAMWEASFFKFLSENTDEANLPRLRDVSLPKGDLVMRFWYDARPYIVRGLVLRRLGDEWSAVHLDLTRGPEHSPAEQEALAAPKSGWGKAWDRLVSAGILTLPDASEVQCRSGVLDGVGYVVELRFDETYRTYRYGNPQHADCGEAKRMVLIEEIIADEFGLKDSR